MRALWIEPYTPDVPAELYVSNARRRRTRSHEVVEGSRPTLGGICCVAIFVVSWALLCACASDPQQSPRPQSETSTREPADERSTFGKMARGPIEIEGTPFAVLWMGSVGIVTSPVWMPWYAAVWAVDGKAVAQARMDGPSGRDAIHEAVATTGPGPPYVSVGPLPASNPNIDFGDYHALVIGNSEYWELRDLRTPINDAEAVATVLSESYGFSVTLLRDATRADIIRSLAELRRNLDKRDNLLIYYAGHGDVDSVTSQGYWLPVDASERDPVNWISNADVTTSLKGTRAKHILVVADSCFSGSLNRSIARRPGNYLIEIARKPARMVLTSGGLEPVSDDGDGTNSVFAVYFLRALDENLSVLEGNELFSRIRRPVMENARQTPEYGPIRDAGHDGGDFLFVRR